MIKAHETNSTWWGSPVGIVTDSAFFALDRAAREALLEPFAWAEFKSPLGTGPTADVLHRAGFIWADAQMNFRIDLRNVPDSPSLRGFQCSSAAEQAFHLEATGLRPFQHERFLDLPGVTTSSLNRRYAAWANELVARNPTWCLQMALDGRPQGWFLADAQGSAVTLTLAMLAPDAAASGQHLYQRCLREFAARGGVIGHAAFSVRNTAVLNIYASLRAHFTTPTGVWMWVSPAKA
jgi:hypothetical protein